jgi:hypothetical protein
MRRGRFLVGLVLLIIGALLIVLVLEVNGGSTTQTVPAGANWQLVPSPYTYTSSTALVHWSGGTSTTIVYLVSGTPTCYYPGGQVANGTGSSGTFSAALDPGTKYYLYACSGTTPATATFTVSVSGGINLLEILGGVAMFIGVLLILIGLMGRPTLQSIFEVGKLATPQPASIAPVPSPFSAPAAESGPVDTSPLGPLTSDVRALVSCPGCDKVWPAGQYRFCPACGHAL